MAELTPELLSAKSPSTMWTVSDREVDPLNFTADMLDIGDVAHHLSMLCRFTGSVLEWYSVGQHSVLVSRLVWDETGDAAASMWGLLHDLPEYLTNDLTRQLKYCSGFGNGYRRVEDNIMSVAVEKYNLPLPKPDVVQWADDIVVRAETRDFKGPKMRELLYSPDTDTYFPERIIGWSFSVAEYRFLNQYRLLKGLR